MSAILVTGASRGLGLEFTRQYLHSGESVIATARKLNEAKALLELKANFPSTLELRELDLSNEKSLNLFFQNLEDLKIAKLINNAGFWGGNDQGLSGCSAEQWMKTMQVNVFAPFFLVQRLAQRCEQIINITSKMGSITDNSSGGNYIYRSTKAALNMVTKSMAIDLQAKGITVIALHPGWVQTDMGGKRAPLSVEESVSGMLAVIGGLTIGDTGKFFAYDGSEIAW